MQVKIFESTDMASGLKLIKETLGPDALILSTRTLRSGKMGILGKPILEITAAIDSPWPEEQQQYLAPTQVSPPARKNNFSQWTDDTVQPVPSTTTRRVQGRVGKHRPSDEPALTRTFREYREEPRGTKEIDVGLHVNWKKTQSRPEQAITYDSQFRVHQEPEETSVISPQKKPIPSREAHPEMHNELDELKKMVKKLGMEISRIGTPGTGQQQGLPPEQRPASALPQQTPDCQKDNMFQLLSMLLELGISETTAKVIRARAQEMLPPDETWDTILTRKRLLQEAIRDLLHVAPQLVAEEKSQCRIALVGPTGVGKTTTLAKIAAHYLSNFSNSIALITIDTYRIAAVEQLKVYGTIMNLPVEVVITPEQLEQALWHHRDKKLILIDTAGRSPRDSLCIEELATFLRPDLAIEKHLVLSATTRRSELFEAIKRFGVLGIDNTIITKTDECSTLGVMLDIQMDDSENMIPLSWITNGQRVPEDLLSASKELVAELIMTPAQGATHDQ
jgi:flagellar biosynthesis protein FlhF